MIFITNADKIMILGYACMFMNISLICILLHEWHIHQLQTLVVQKAIGIGRQAATI